MKQAWKELRQRDVRTQTIDRQTEEDRDREGIKKKNGEKRERKANIHSSSLSKSQNVGKRRVNVTTVLLNSIGSHTASSKPNVASELAREGPTCRLMDLTASIHRAVCLFSTPLLDN